MPDSGRVLELLKGRRSSGTCSARKGCSSRSAADGRAEGSCVSMQRRKSAHAGEMLGGSGRMRCSEIACLISAFSRPSNGRWPARARVGVTGAA